MTVDFPVTPDWVSAGKAIFTVYNASGEHYTYKVSRKDNDDICRPFVWFVSLLTGPDNLSDYTYLGCMNPTTGALRLTRASRHTRESTPVAVFEWAMRIVWAEGAHAFPEGYGVKGEGRCGRCGRALTHPDGVADNGYRLGYGESCWTKICGG